MPSNSITFAAVVIAAAILGVYGVFQYLEASGVNRLDIETALLQSKQTKCDATWGSESHGGKGVVVLGDGKARLDYIYRDGGRENLFLSILDRTSGDMYVWTPGQTSVVHLANALSRNDIQDPWWNLAELSNCKPAWTVNASIFSLPPDARTTER